MNYKRLTEQQEKELINVLCGYMKGYHDVFNNL